MCIGNQAGSWDYGQRNKQGAVLCSGPAIKTSSRDKLSLFNMFKSASAVIHPSISAMAHHGLHAVADYGKAS
jgi:hypothetical protein